MVWKEQRSKEDILKSGVGVQGSHFSSLLLCLACRIYFLLKILSWLIFRVFLTLEIVLNYTFFFAASHETPHRAFTRWHNTPQLLHWIVLRSSAVLRGEDDHPQILLVLGLLSLLWLDHAAIMVYLNFISAKRVPRFDVLMLCFRHCLLKVLWGVLRPMITRKNPLTTKWRMR